MPYTEFTCRSGGNNLYAGSLDGSAEASNTALVSYANGGFNSGTGVFTPASGNPVTDGVAVGNFVSLYPSAVTYNFSGASGAIPTGWDNPWATANITWAENVAGFLRATPTAAGVYGLRAAQTQPFYEVEITTMIRTNTGPSGSGLTGGIVWGASGGIGTQTARQVFGLYSQAGTAQFCFGDLSNAVFTNRGTGFAGTWVANTWYWLKVKVVSGLYLQCKAWADGGAEPAYSSPFSSFTGTSALLGWIGVFATGAASGTATVDFDDFTFLPLSTNCVARVTAVSSTTVTVSTTAKSGTIPTTATSGITAVVGGAWAGPSNGTGFPFNFAASTMTNTTTSPPRVNFKNDQTYAVAAALTHSLSGNVSFFGYSSSFGDLGKFTIDGGANLINILTISGGNNVVISDFVITSTAASGTNTGLSFTGQRNRAQRGVISGIRSTALALNNGTAEEVEIYNSLIAATSNVGVISLGSGSVTRCTIHDNPIGSSSAAVLFSGSVAYVTDCIFDTNTGPHVACSNSDSSIIIESCSFYNATGSSINMASGSARVSCVVENCTFVSNSAYGISYTSANGALFIRNCAFFSNTSGQKTVAATVSLEETGTVTLTASPFVDAPNGDFRLNNTSGAGADCRGTGRGTFTQTQSGYAGTVGYPDIGAAQHQDSATGGVSGSRIFTGV